MAKPQKGLRDIRTLAGRVDQVALPYKAFMQIACLEMEKHRRGVERSNAKQRIENLDSRLHEIEIEEAELLCAVGKRGGDKPTSSNARLLRLRGTAGLRVKY